MQVKKDISRWVHMMLASVLSLGSAQFCLIANGQQTKEAKEAFEFAPRQTADALGVLSASSRSKIERLAALESLPVSKWKFHAGELAHGESIDLDDAAWTDIKLPYDSTTHDTVWIRTWIQVPKSLSGYDLTGASLQLESSRDKTVTIYLNGQRIASGADLEPITLLGKVKPGDRAFVAVRIDADEEDLQSIPAVDLTVVTSGARPDPQEVRTEFVSAALLIPYLADNKKDAYDTLERAIAQIDCKALDENDQARFDASLRQAHETIQNLRPVLQNASMWLVGNSHIDAAWLWPWTETVDVVHRTFSTTLQLMREYPDFKFTQSAAQYSEWMAEKYPELNKEIKQRIQEGRWEIVGGMWVEPDLNMPGGESLVRQLLVGQHIFQKLYGVTAKIGWNPDSFGYNWQLPQIYKRSGINYFVTQKMAWNETNPLPMKLFWWQSPDGSKVLTYFPHTYSNVDLDPIRLSNDWVNARKLAPGTVDLMDLYGVGDHGGGATREILDQGEKWIQAHNAAAPQMRFETADRFFHDVEGKVSPVIVNWNYRVMGAGAPALPEPPSGKISIPTWNDELYFEHHRGTYTTQGMHKKNMRNSENWLLNAEEYASLAWLGGETYPKDSLTEAWKKALFNQFHDLAAGSGIGILYKDAQKDYDQVRWATDEVSQKSMKAIAERIETGNRPGVPILVFNPLGWARAGLVEFDVQMPSATNDIAVIDTKNRVLPSQILKKDSSSNSYRLLVQAKDVPSVGYEVLDVVSGKRPGAGGVTASDTTLENESLRVSVDPHSGCITSLYQKKAGFEAIAHGGCGNQIQFFKDTPTEDDAWNIDPGTLDHVIPLQQADSVKLVENGTLRSAIRVVRSWQNSKIVQDIVLYAGADQVEIENEIDWHETHVLMKAAFPLAASSNMATYEIPFGTIDRPTTRGNSWDKAKFEVPSLRWADLGNGKTGVSILNDSKYGYDAEGNVLRLTLLRSPIEPDADADRGHHRFKYALYPHAGDWKSALTIRRGYEYNNRLLAMQIDAHTGNLPDCKSFIRVDRDDVILSAVKKAEDENALILRFYEWKGESAKVQVDLPEGAKSAIMTNLMEVPEGSPLGINSNGSTDVVIGPYQILTVRADYSAPMK